MSDMIKVSIQMRDSGAIVREDVILEDKIDEHLMFLTYYWGMDDEAWVDKKEHAVRFHLRDYKGMADIFFLPA